MEAGTGDRLPQLEGNDFAPSREKRRFRNAAAITGERLPGKSVSLSMSPSHAVMIVDVQRAFAPPPAFVDKVRRYSRRFHCRVFTKFLNPPGSMFRRILKQRSCAPGSADRDLLILPEPDDLVFDKASYGLTPSHLKRLKARGIKRLTVCGLDTDACVMGVMFSLFDAGIVCHLKEEMCWSSSGLHSAAMKILRSQFPETH